MCKFYTPSINGMFENEGSEPEASDDDSFEEEDSDDDSSMDSDAEESSGGGGAESGGEGEAEPEIDELVDEEEDIVKAFKDAKEINRNHPPDINVEDDAADLSFHPNEDIIAIGTMLGDILLYKYSNESCELKETLEVHTETCRCTEFSQDGLSIFSASKDKSIIQSDLQTSKMKLALENAHDDPIYKLKLIDENRFATGDENGMVKVWDCRTKEAIFCVKQTDDFVSDIVTNEAKKYLVCSSGEGVITTLDLGMRRFHVQSEPYECELHALSLVKQERKLVTATSTGRFYIFNWGQFGYHSDEFPGPKLAINCMLPLTENIVVTGYEDGKIRATHLFPHQQLGIVGQHNFPVEQMDISRDGEFLASSSHDGFVKFWNIRYFEDVHVTDKDKKDKRKILNHNLPSSKASNPGDFFADLAETS